jgi:hypothetical protein
LAFFDVSQKLLDLVKEWGKYRMFGVSGSLLDDE